jgi:hypothetical protein
LLKEIAARFKQTLRASDVIARLGGDEFVVLVQEVSDREHAATVARKMLSAAIKPMMLIGQECRVTASIGIALFPGDGEDEQALMKNADSAMYFAKEEGKNNFQFYTSEISSQSLERLTLESNLRHAMERREFSTTRPSSTSRPVQSPASRPCCAGRAPSWARSRRTSSSPSPKRLASSSTSAAGCSRPRASRTWPGSAKACRRSTWR